MSKYSLLGFYREIVNSEKSFDIDYKNLSKQLIERIDKAIEHLNKRNEQNYGALSNPENTIISKHQLLDLEITNNNILLEILGDKENENNR